MLSQSARSAAHHGSRVRRALPLRALGALPAAIVIAFIVNAVLLGAYAWSRGGQETLARVEVNADEVRTYIDGRPHMEALAPITGAGNIIIRLESTDSIPSLPTPRGIDRITVTSLESGAVTFEDDFSTIPVPGKRWLKVRGQLFLDDGVLGSHAELLLEFDPGIDDGYAVEVTYRNVTTTSIAVRAELREERLSGVLYSFRPFRHIDASLNFMDDGATSHGIAGPRIEIPRERSLKSLVAMALDPYPMIALLLVAGFVIAMVAQFAVPLFDRAATWIRWREINTLTAVGIVAVAAFSTTAYLLNVYGAAMPHVPDELSYLFQSKVLASGRLSVPPPDVLAPFEIGNPPLITVSDGRWASLYPFGHPLALAVGQRFGIVSYTPPLIGAASVLLVFLVGRRLYSVRAGLLAALMLAASPFFLMTASNFMAHNTAAFYLIISILLLATSDRRPIMFTALSGVFLGLVFATRPLSGAALVPPFGLFLMLPLLQRGQRIDGLKRGGAFAVAGFAMLLLYWGYKYATTGDPFTVDPIQGGPDALGFSGTHSVDAGISQEQTQMAFLALVLHNWPIATGLVFASVPFILGTRHRWDWFLLGCAVCLMGAYTAYFFDGLMYGPRFWYEAAPLLILLTARGADRTAHVLASAIVAAGATRPRDAIERGAAVVVFVFLGAMAAIGGYDWVRGDGGDWRVDAVPYRAKELRGFNGVGDGLLKAIRAARLNNALVLVEDCPHWWCYGSVFWKNSPTLDGNVVYARHIPDKEQELLQAYPDRAVYRAVYDPSRGSLERYGGPASGESAPSEASRAREALRVRDERRRADLEEIAKLLAAHYARHDSYPVSPQLQSLCRRESDVGCELKALGEDLPEDPRAGRSYLYRSDGVEFAVVALLEGVSGAHGCPDDIGARLTTTSYLLCLTGSRGSTD